VAKRVRVRISGDVQGVSFRWYCSKEASSRRVGGFIRNLPDGRVEAAFEGNADGVDAMVEWCRHGPPSARVQGVDVSEEPLTGERDFTITR
jgi:acylphosphatase